MKRLLKTTLGVLPCAILLSSCVYWTPRSHTPTAAAGIVSDVPLQKWDILSCGAGALSSVLQSHGEPTTMDEWQEALPKTRGGVLSIDLVLAARQKGFESKLETGDAALIESEVRAGRPVILMLQVVQGPGKSYDFFHYIVVDGYDPERQLFRTQFGDGKARWTTMAKLTPAWKKTSFATIVIRPADPNAEALRAAVRLEDEGRHALAAHAYREILQRDPESILAWTNLGNAEMQMGRTPAAEEAFRKALSLDPEAADTLNNLAWLLYQERRLDEAEPLARRAVAVKAPDPWMRLDTLARILTARGECNEAQSTFRLAIDSLPASRTSERQSLERAMGVDCAPADDRVAEAARIITGELPPEPIKNQ